MHTPLPLSFAAKLLAVNMPLQVAAAAASTVAVLAVVIMAVAAGIMAVTVAEVRICRRKFVCETSSYSLGMLYNLSSLL
jgi:hypothetical protein